MALPHPETLPCGNFWKVPHPGQTLKKAEYDTNNDEKADDTALKVSEEDKAEEKVDDAK